MELIFEIRDAEEGGFCARALGHVIFTEGDTWEELRANLLEAVSLHFDDAPSRPHLVQMHYVRDELVSVEAARSCRAGSPAIASSASWNGSDTLLLARREVT